MVSHLNLDRYKTREDILRFLEGNAAAYEHIGQVLRRFSYGQLNRPERGRLKRYLASGELSAGRRGDRRRASSTSTNRKTASC